MFLNANIDIHATVPPGANDMKTVHQNLPAVLFLILSIFCLTPTLTRADQSPPETIIIDASGQATAIGSGPSGAASLNLTADAYKNSNDWRMIQNTTGVLQIGSTEFTITGGQGSVSKAGAIAIFADTATGKGQLILQGTTKGDTVTFDTPSQLASVSYLTLSGNINNSAKQTATPTTSITMNSPNTVANVTTSTSSLNVTERASSTSTLSTSPVQNATTQANTSFTTTGNATVGVTTTANFAASSSAIENGTTSNNNGTGQHTVTIHVVQGQGEICLSSQDQMPVCTSVSQTVSVNDGELVNFDATADNGFTWDHYDGIGIGQTQDFNAVITQDTATGVYFKPMSTANATAAINLPTDSITPISSSHDSTTTIPIANITMPLPSNVPATVTHCSKSGSYSRQLR